MRHLFSDSFLASIDGLSVDIRPAPPRAPHGAHLSPRVGSSIEFRDYQSYTPGDDLRRVDWNVYARTRHLFVRRFEHPTSVPIFLLVDDSESMRLETPSRYATAARVAAAVAAAGLASQNPVYATIADGGGAALPRAVTGRRGLVRVLAELASDRPTAGIGVAAGISVLQPLLAAKGRGVLVIISDFFEPLGVQTLLESLRQTSQRLLLVRVTQPWDANPDLAGDFELADCESGETAPVSTDAEALRRYREAYGSYFAAIDGHVAQRGATQHVIDASKETLPQLEPLFPGGVLSL